MQATLSAPLTLNPQQAVVLVIESFTVEPDAGVLTVRYRLVDSGGNLLERRTVTSNAPNVQTWITNQTTTIYNALLNKLGLTGTVA